MHTDTHTKRIAAIGPEELVSLLESVGIDTYAATTAEEAEAHITTIHKDTPCPYAIVCVTEQLANTVSTHQRRAMEESTTPTFLVIPDLTSVSGSGVARIRELAKRATGNDILGTV
jgi:vacuolar-type H+-ATPase subunit F/Vma7